MLTISQKSYTASTIDSEGSIGIYRKVNTNSFKSSIRIKMNDPQALMYIHKNFGGRLYEEEVKDRRNSHIYVLAFESKAEIRRLWRECNPFFKVKREQMKRIIEFLDLRERANKLRRRGKKNIHLQYFNLAKSCQSLKSRY